MTITLDLSLAKSDIHVRRTLADLSLSVAKCKKIVVVTGAGISCSCGIPDFRSSDGLYGLVKQKYPGVVLKGRDLFDASLFRDATSTSVFYSFISGLKKSIDSATPTPTHRFIKTLDTKKKLLRSYTQNIDGLEERAGLLSTSSQEARSDKGKKKLKAREVRNVQLHGDIHRVRCLACSAEYPCTREHLDSFDSGTPPDCPDCLSRCNARIARSARPLRVGTLRPAIVLYDEPHPLGDDIGLIQSADLMQKPEMLIIMGTSLKVHGLKKLVKEFAKAVHDTARQGTKSHKGRVLFINRTPPSSEWSDVIDYHVAGDTDVWVTAVISEWKKCRPADWEVQKTLVDTEGNSDHELKQGFKAMKLSSVTDVKKVPRRKAGPTGPENERPPSDPAGAVGDSSTVARAAKPPRSPSKRQHAVSHYGNLESSPTKKRISTSGRVILPDGERKLLFTETTNTPVAEKDGADMFKVPMEMTDMAESKKPVRSEPTVVRCQGSGDPLEAAKRRCNYRSRQAKMA